MSMLNPKVQDAAMLVRQTFDDIVKPVAKSQLSAGQFHELNDKMEIFLKSAGFTESQTTKILMRQWMRVANQFDIKLPEDVADA